MFATQIFIMKKQLIVLIISLIVFSCKSDNVDPSYNVQRNNLGVTSLLFGKWKLQSFEDNQPISKDIIIEFTPEKNAQGNHTLSGKCVVNFYQAIFSFDNDKKLLSVKSLASTEIATNSTDASMETKYFTTLSKVTKFSFEKNATVVVLSTDKNEKLIFKSND